MFRILLSGTLALKDNALPRKMPFTVSPLTWIVTDFAESSITRGNPVI